MIGDIIASCRTTHDYGLLCDGSLIPSGSDYDTLRSLIGNNTPDLRDFVLKGNKEGRVILSYEADANKSHSHLGSSIAAFTGNVQNSTHTHSGGDHSHPIPYSSVNGSNLFCREERGNSQSGTINNMSSASHSHSGGDHVHAMTHGHVLSISSDGSSQTLVRNKSVNYFIIYKEVLNSMTDEQSLKLDYIYNNMSLTVNGYTFSLMDLIKSNLAFYYSPL